MKSLFLGIAIIILVGLGGFFYRYAVEYAARPVACPVAKLTCPDGTELTHVGVSCTFPACPPPNVTFTDLGISFVTPAGFTSGGGAAGIAAGYTAPVASSTEQTEILIRRYPIEASSTALTTIQKTAINATADQPVSPERFTSVTLGTHSFTVVPIDRFEGVVDTAYYLARGTDVLRFEAIDRGVDWSNPALDTAALPAHAALRQLLTSLQGE